MSNTAGGNEAGEWSTPKKRLKRRSEVWEHFTKIDNGTAANCKYCNKKFSLKYGTTTHLNRHLSSCDKIPNRTIPHPLTIDGNSERAAMGQPPTTHCEVEIRNYSLTQAPPTLACGVEVRKFDLTQEMSWKIQVKNAILSDISFAPPNVKKAWSSLMGMEMEKEICAYHQREKDKLLTEFGRLTSRVCFSIKIMKEGWISITAHFINSEFILEKKLIGFKKLPDVSSNLCKATDIIENCILDWKLGNKIFTFTTEGNDLYLSLKEKFQSKMLLDWDEMLSSCFKKTVGQWYYDNLKRWCSNAKNKIIKFGEDVLQTDLGKCKFNEIAKEKGLSPLNEDWLKGQPIGWYAGTDFWKFCCPVVRMFKYALLYKEVFVQCALRKMGDGPFSEIDLAGVDWPELEEAVECFEAINPIIDLLFNFKYPTSNLRFQSEIKIRQMLSPHGKVEHWPCILYVACMLDPRYKLVFLEYFLKEVYNSCFWGDEVYRIRKLFETLFNVYAKEETIQVSPVSSATANAQENSSSKSSTNKNLSAVIDRFPLYIKELKATKRFEMDEYLAEEIIDIGDRHFNLLGWWKQNTSHYPVLSRMARDVLAIPACVYNVDENLKLDLAVLQGVNPEVVEAAICSKSWILSDAESPQEIVHRRTDQQPLNFASATTNDHIHNYGENTVNADNAQHDSDVEILYGTSPVAPGPNNVSEEKIGFSENNQETPQSQPTPHTQLSSKNAPDEDDKKIKAAMHRVREKNRGNLVLRDKFGLRLKTQEILAVEFVEQIEPTVVIVNMEADPDNYIRLTGAWMKSLVRPLSMDGGARWLVDEVLNAFINIINHRRDLSHKVQIVSTFDTQFLRGRPRKICKPTSKIRELGIKFLNNDIVFFPINIYDVHWIVGALNFTRREFQILDSNLNNSTSKNIYDCLKYELFSGIQECIHSVLDSNEARQVAARSKQADAACRNVTIIKTAPQQTDGSSCGLFALRYMQFWDGSSFPSDVSFSATDMEIFRKQIVAELIMSELNLMRIIPQEITLLESEFSAKQVKVFCTVKEKPMELKKFLGA